MSKTNWINIFICTSLLAIISFVFLQSNVIFQSQHQAGKQLFKLQSTLVDLDAAIEEMKEVHHVDATVIEDYKKTVLSHLADLNRMAREVNNMPLIFPAMLTGKAREFLDLQIKIDGVTTALNTSLSELLNTNNTSEQALEKLLLPNLKKVGIAHNLDVLNGYYNDLDGVLAVEGGRYTAILYAAFVALLIYILWFAVHLRHAGIKLEQQVLARSDALEAQNLELIDARENALQAVRLKSEFLATMSHEIRTPMNGILGMAQMLKDTSMTGKQEQYIRTLEQSSESLLELVNDILDFSKIESGRMELENSVFSLDDVAEDVVEMLSGRAREKELEVFLRYVPDTPNMIEGDRVRIRQILANLVGNAVKFTESGFVKLTVGIEAQLDIALMDDEVCLHVSVEDTGVGIPSDKLDYIFDKFSQADSSTTRKFGGTGLGLAICRELTAMMRGKIWVESELGKGSVFHFTMVVKNGGNDAVVTNQEILRILQNRKVLVVDDVKEYALMLSEALSLQGIKAYAAYSGKEALQLLHLACVQGEPFDVAILDYMMPEMDGIELAKYITVHENKQISQMPLIMLTAVVGKLYTTRFRDAGFAAYLVKPYRLQQILKTLAEVLIARLQGGVMPIMSNERTKEQADNFKHFIGTRVLLVEDNKVNQEVAMRLLDKLGCMVIIAQNGVEAVNILAKEAFDMVFMDCQMPEMDGYEATHIIRSQKLTSAPIVALTANAMRGDKEKCLEAGMDDYIAKPVHFDDILKMLQKWLTKKDGLSVFEKVSHEHDAVSSPVYSESDTVQHVPVLCMKSWQTLKDMVGSSFEMILEHYKTGSDNSLATIKQSFEDKNFVALMRAAHSLKSSSAQIGALIVSALAKEIENASRSNVTPDEVLLADLIARIEKAHHDSMAAIEAQSL